MRAEKIRWSASLRREPPTLEDMNGLADDIILAFEGDSRFRQHIADRFKSVTEATGQSFDSDSFDLSMARALIADEIGFKSWDQLEEFVRHYNSDDYPILFKYAIAALWRGDFTALETTVGGPDAFYPQVRSWLDAGFLSKEPETMAECFAAACMLGHPDAAAALLDAGVDPYAGMRTGLSGFHYAASSGRLNVVKLLVDRKLPMEVRNMYGGTVLGQALWSAVYEHTTDHAAIIERLIEAGAEVESGTLAWWNGHEVPDDKTRVQVAAVLTRQAQFHERVEIAKHDLTNAEATGSKKSIADALKALPAISYTPVRCSLIRPIFHRQT